MKGIYGGVYVQAGGYAEAGKYIRWRIYTMEGEYGKGYPQWRVHTVETTHGGGYT